MNTTTKTYQKLNINLFAVNRNTDKRKTPEGTDS